MRRLCIALSAWWLLGCGGTTVGASCSDAVPCATPLVCVQGDRPDVRQCMRSCAADADSGPRPRLCSDGSLCVDVGGVPVCYIGGHTPYGTACTSALACEPGTTCSSDRGMCEQACEVGVDAPCAARELCTELDGGLCRRAILGVCSDAHPCAVDLVCAASDRRDVTVCMERCEASSRLCGDGSVCLDFGGTALCNVGGHRLLGEGCESTYACEPGSVCSDAATRVCEHACAFPDALLCKTGDLCVDVTGGVCRPPPTP